MKRNLLHLKLVLLSVCIAIFPTIAFAQSPHHIVAIGPNVGVNRLPDNPSTPTGPFSAQGGVWRFQGLAGKCLDTGGYPLGHTNPVVLYDCNGTSAQDITLLPFGNSTAPYQYELQAHDRCLTVQHNDVVVAAAVTPVTVNGGTNVLNGLRAGDAVILAPCNNNANQRFFVGNQIFPASNINLVITVQNSSSANHTPLVLEPITANNPAQTWQMIQFDTTPYSWTPVIATVGSYAFVGFGSKCIDIGGEPHPEHSPVFLYGCNGTLAQYFAIKSADEHLGTFNITGFGKCFDIAGGTVKLGAALELNACSGSKSQLFSFDDFDKQYIYPAGFPELAVGARGPSSDNHTPLELQWRTPADYQNWQATAVENASVGPKAPSIHLDKQKVNNSYVPAIAVQVNSSLSAGYAVYWKQIGGSTGYVGKMVSVNGLTPGQSTLAALPELNAGVEYVLKVRATIDSGAYSESPTVLIDARQLPQPPITIDTVESNQVTLSWKSAGTPQANGFDVNFYPGSSPNPVASRVGARTGTGLSNVTYTTTVSGLQPNTQYGAYVNVTRDLWAGVGSNEANVMTLPAQTTTTQPNLTTIWMQRQDVVEGYIPYAGKFGPIFNGATITNVNFPVQYPPVLLVKPGHSTEDCGNSSDVVEVQGDMTASQKMAIWGTATLKITGTNALLFVGCATSTNQNIANILPVNITWTSP